MMRARLIVPAVLALIFIDWAIAADESPGRIAVLIGKLGSLKFAEREAATRALDIVGEPALEPLRTALKSNDAEVRRRAAAIVERIEQRVANAKLLAPTLVALDLENLSLTDAVANLKRQTGLEIQLSDSAAQKVVNLRSKPLPVWEAIELFCRKTELREWDGYTTMPTGFSNAQAPQFQQQVIGGGNIIFLNRGRTTMRSLPGTDGRVMLHDSAASPTLSVCSGSVRVRLLPVGTPFPSAIPGRDEAVFPLHVSPEPRLTMMNVLSATIERAVDDLGQTLIVSDLRPDPTSDDLEFVIMPAGVIQTRPARPRGTQIALRVRTGDKVGQRIAELRGQLTADVVIADTVANVSARAVADHPIASTCGVTGKMLAVDRADQAVRYSLELAVPPAVALATGRGMPPAELPNRGIMLRAAAQTEQMDLPFAPPGTTQFGALSLEDAQGKRLEIAGGSWKRMSVNGQGGNYQITVTFRLGDTEPARLVFTGTRPGTVQVPFAFKDVPLQ
ncbi:MAG: hypothetical protein U0746_22595 [Gemmataceae bacterium]